MNRPPIPGSGRLSGLLCAVLACAAAAAAPLVASPAGAQPPAGAPPHVDSRSPAEVRALAGEHFRRGLVFFEENRLDAALAEFRLANEISPTPEALYNLGRVHEELGEAVEAAAIFERYLREGGDRLTPARVREARERLERQRGRVARLWIETEVVGAVISIDGIDRARTPLREPILLAAGRHELTLHAPDFDTARLEVQLAGGEERREAVSLRRIDQPRGVLRIVSNVPDTEILVDGEPVGRTPLDSTIPVAIGDREVLGRRVGYLEDRERVQVSEGAEVRVGIHLEFEPDPAPEEVGELRLELPQASAEVRIDGERLELPRAGGARLPRGVHRLEVRVVDREPEQIEIQVPAADTLQLRLELRWRPDALDARMQAVRRDRLVGQVLSAGGLGVFGLCAGLFVWNEQEIRRTDQEIAQISERCRTGCSLDDERRGRQLEDAQSSQSTLRFLFPTLSLAGIGALIYGLVRWMGAPDDEAIERSASAALRLLPTPGGAALVGRF